MRIVRVVAWVGAAFYALLVVLAAHPLTSTGESFAWAAAGLLVPLFAVALTRTTEVMRRVGVIGFGLFVAAFLIMNGYVVAS